MMGGDRSHPRRFPRPPFGSARRTVSVRRPRSMAEERPPDGPPPPRGDETYEGGGGAATLVHKLTVLRDALTREMQSVWAAEGRVYDMGKKLEKVRDQLNAVQRELDLQRAKTDAAEQRASEPEELLEGHRPAGMSEEL